MYRNPPSIFEDRPISHPLPNGDVFQRRGRWQPVLVAGVFAAGFMMAQAMGRSLEPWEASSVATVAVGIGWLLFADEPRIGRWPLQRRLAILGWAPAIFVLFWLDLSLTNQLVAHTYGDYARVVASGFGGVLAFAAGLTSFVAFASSPPVRDHMTTSDRTQNDPDPAVRVPTVQVPLTLTVNWPTSDALAEALKEMAAAVRERQSPEKPVQSIQSGFVITNDPVPPEDSTMFPGLVQSRPIETRRRAKELFGRDDEETCLLYTAAVTEGYAAFLEAAEGLADQKREQFFRIVQRMRRHFYDGGIEEWGVEWIGKPFAEYERWMTKPHHPKGRLVFEDGRPPGPNPRIVGVRIPGFRWTVGRFIQVITHPLFIVAS